VGVLEAIVDGVFGILRLGLAVALWLWLAPPLMRRMSKAFGGRWGQPDGSLPTFSPRRLWCRHNVAWHGPGTFGRWSMWCEYCGKEVRGR
jgi:hypothetical protein